MSKKKISAIITVMFMFLVLMPPCVSADDTVTFTAVDGRASQTSYENYTNLFDGKKTAGDYTKYCLSTNNSEVYVVAEASEQVIVTGYTFTTGNDSQSYINRNPKSWVLYGSNDYDTNSKQGTWTEIHSVTNDTTMQNLNYTPYTFTFDNDEEYNYYKFVFKETQGSTEFQLCEIEFIHTLAAVHDWETVSQVDADCINDGYLVKICKDCGKQKTEKIPALGHNWAETSKVEPTCVDPGKLYENCTVCGEERESVLPPLYHVKGEDNLCAKCNKALIRIGNTNYFDLHDAVDAVAHDQTIEILQNINIDSEIVVNKYFTIELNGFTIRQTGDSRLITVNKTLTIKDSSENHTGTLCGGNASKTLMNGGGILVDEYGVLNMIGGTISDCTAYSQGGGIYVNNTAKLYMSGNAAIKNCTAVNTHGGGIMNYGTAEIRDSSIINCKATSGGGIYTNNLKGGGTLNIYNSVIEGCSASMNGGGGITATAAAVTIDEKSVIRKNTATGNYGAGILATDGSIVKINNSQITENTANEGAGILANSGSSIILNGSEVTNNSANSNGGGIMLGTASLTIENSSISLNKTGTNGGGIYASYNSDVTLDNGEIDGNSAQWGGGVYLHYGSTVTMSEGSYIKNNTAVYNGAGIILNDSNAGKAPTLTMTGGSISFNESDGSKGDGNGGGICGQKNAVINISGGTIDCNKAVNGGGIQLFNNSSANISGGHILMNTAKAGNGGGININNKSTATLKGGSVSQNNASGLGGGIYSDGTLNVCAAPQVSGNYIGIEDETGTSEVKNNIYLPNGKIINITDDGLKLDETMYISPELGVTAAKGTANITNSRTEDYSEFFKTDNLDYAVIYENGIIKLAKSFKVTFDYYGDDQRVEAVAQGHPIAEPDAEPWRADGYVFAGWLLNGADYDFSTPITSNITLTPRWAESTKAAIYVNYSKFFAVGINQNVDIYLAVYDKDGNLTDIRIEKIRGDYFPVSLSKSFKELGINTENSAKITAFLWSENMKPLCDKDFIELS